MSEKTDPVLEAVKNIDLSNVTAEEVFKDVIEQSRQFAFRMAIASTILDIIQRPAESQPAPAAEQQEQATAAPVEPVEVPLEVVPDIHPAHIPPPAPELSGAVEFVVVS